MKIEYFLTSAVSFVLFSVVVISCSKQQNSSAGKGQLQVYLSDNPADYDQVIIDVKDVQINVTADSSGGWQSLSTVNAGTYDLLKLVNDHDTLLAHSDIPTGMIHQMRLILGDNNYVVVNGQNIPLKTPSAQESGLKLNIQQNVTSGILYKITLDFDAAKSIVKTGNGKYLLKPVIRTVLSAVGGSIKGFVLPDSVTTAVYAIQAPDTIASTFSSNGGYLIKGIAGGSYTLSFVPNDTSYTSQTKAGIVVTTGNVTIVDTVHLHH
jgi:uncharacterized protein DUF4382